MDQCVVCQVSLTTNIDCTEAARQANRCVTVEQVTGCTSINVQRAFQVEICFQTIAQIFSAFQAPTLLTDLANLQARLPAYPDVVELLDEIRLLTRRVAEDARLRLRFSGR